MDVERHPRPAPPARTFAQVFPWRSLRRALMLVVLIVAIVVIKQRMQGFLQQAGRLWGPMATSTVPAPGAVAPTAAPGERGPVPGTATIHLGPSLAPMTAPADLR